MLPAGKQIHVPNACCLGVPPRENPPELGILLEGGGQKFLNRDPDSVPLLIVASLGKKKSKTTTREGETGHLSLVGMGYWKGGELVLVG